MGLIPRRNRAARNATGTPPSTPPHDPLAGLLPASERPKPTPEPEDVRIPIPGGDLVIVAGQPFGSTGSKPEQPTDDVTAFNEGARALAEAFASPEAK